jgi:hypothetical protein
MGDQQPSVDQAGDPATNRNSQVPTNEPSRRESTLTDDPVLDVVREAEEAARRNRNSRPSIVVDPEEAELLELIRAYLVVAVITGTFTSMICHLTGEILIRLNLCKSLIDVKS